MNRTVLAGAESTITRFFASGVMELKDKLGPINWQFMPTKIFDPADFEAFLKLLPKEVAGRALRHVVEVRHDSFRSPISSRCCASVALQSCSRRIPITRKSPMPPPPSSTPVSWEQWRSGNSVIRMLR